jgi:hypothetical protein
MVGQEPRRETISLEKVTVELRRVVRRGLPANRQSVGELLPHVTNVVARAIHPDDFFSRLDAFNELLTQLLNDLSEHDLGEAPRILFGVSDGFRGTKLTTRREHCANLLGYDFDHFRKRVETRILDTVTEAFYRDLLRYRSRVRRTTTAFETGRPTPALRDVDISQEEELVSRIWQRLYEVRAERIAGRLTERAVAQKHRQKADRAARHLQTLVDQYVDTYGRKFIPNGELEYAVEGLEKLVVWRTGTL